MNKQIYDVGETACINTGEYIEFMEQFKYLRVMYHRQLSFCLHAKQVCKKARKKKLLTYHIGIQSISFMIIQS